MTDLSNGNGQGAICAECGASFAPNRNVRICSDACRAKRNVRNQAEWRKANADLIRANTKRYWKENPEKVLAGNRKWMRANKAKVAATTKDWERRNRERTLARQRRWTKAHPEAAQAKYNTRRTRLTNAGGKYTKADIRWQYVLQLGLCYYCSRPLNGKYDADHKIAVSRGGTSWPDNMVCACRGCNLRKQAMTNYEFFSAMYPTLCAA